MNTIQTSVIVSAALFLASPSSARAIQPRAIPAAAAAAMQQPGAKGLAIATITNGKVRTVQTFGVRNAPVNR